MMKVHSNEIADLLLHQLANYWKEIDSESISLAVPIALARIEENYTGLPNTRFWTGEEVVFSPYYSVQWMNFLYRVSRVLYLENKTASADQVYYLNKIMHGNDWFYAVDLPTHFLCEHPLGSVLGRAKYGDYFFVYQGTTVGGNRNNGKLYYPEIGKNVILFANATVLGNTRIGDNVVIGADSFLINETVPDNCVVTGKTPNLTIKQKTEAEIKGYTQHIWGWSFT